MEVQRFVVRYIMEYCVFRLLLTRDEANNLNLRIERFLVRLSPYLQQFAAQQALEWLIYKYHVSFLNFFPIISCIRMNALLCLDPFIQC